MNDQEQKYQEAKRKAFDFGKSFSELNDENKKRLVYEVSAETGSLHFLNNFVQLMQNRGRRI